MCIRDRYECELLKEDVELPDYTFKAILIGDAGVGKSCILYRAVKNEFKETYEVTIGAEFCSLILRINGKTLKLQTWDTAGQENFRSMIRVFYKGTHAAFLVYDITNKETFDKLDDWLEDVKENALPEVKLVLVGNQKDNESKREVTTEAAKQWAEKNQFTFCKETSAKTGEGIHEMFIEIAKMLFLDCLLYTSPSPRDLSTSRMPSSA
eukprot:TRINITY_DN7812_c0_g1_i1.p1 TRINITY_DN7812_c0_g1~~TRINITY_DN7812_c0_g1_i1.p1  ORF type:complete len:209 (-),score=74.51 TRINITY_DN7812_c0_g1_i1:23-649(-)